MKLIIGLGNPGLLYAKTRHNAGAMFIEWLAKNKLNCKSSSNSAKCQIFEANPNLALCIPSTYMNESGKALHALLRKYQNVIASDLIIVHDDL